MSRDAARYPAVTRTPTLRTSWQSTLCLAEQPPQATWELEEQDRIQNPLPDHLPQVQTHMRVVASNLGKEVRILHTEVLPKGTTQGTGRGTLPALESRAPKQQSLAGSYLRR